MREPDLTKFIAYPLTDAGNTERFLDVYADEFAYVPGLGWYHWDQLHGFWDGGDSDARRLAFEMVKHLEVIARDYPDTSISTAFRRHAKRSDSGPPIRRLLRIASQDERVRRNPASFDESTYEPATYGERVSSFAERADGRSVFFASRFAAKLRTEETFARKGSRESYGGKLYRLQDGKFVPCRERYFANRGPQELGAEWRALYGWLTSRWLIAAAPTIEAATVALEDAS